MGFRRKLSSVLLCFVFHYLTLFVQATEESSLDTADRRLQQEEDEDSIQHLRIAVFGSSNSWGATLQSRYEAYPYLLSSSVKNYASYAAGPNYAAVCAYSMVGEDETFDVIILEFWLKASEGLFELATRLRRRFPRAIIVFAKVWSPLTARRQNLVDKNETDIFGWKVLEKGLARNATYPEVIDALTDDDDGYWYFPDYELADEVFASAIDAVGGVLAQFPMRDTVVQTLIAYLGYFEQSHHLHLSKLGHEAMARFIRMIVTSQPLPDDMDVHSDWDTTDACHDWFETGSCPFEHSSDKWTMREITALPGRYALDVPSAGWMKVKNDFDDARTVYLAYLAGHAGLYSPVIARFDDEPGVILNTTVDDYLYTQKHYTKTTAIGILAPHSEVNIILTLIDSTLLNDNLGEPFRLLGVILPDPIAVPKEIGFGTYFVS